MANPQNNKTLSRRKFMALAGGVAGVATIGAIGMFRGLQENNPEIAPEDISFQEDQAELLVIGSGMAGLFAAVKAHDAGAKVMLVSKGRLGSSGQTPFAKGIFAYDPNTSEVSLDEFVEKVSLSALGTNNPVYTRQVAEHSLARVNELKEWGFFESPLYFNAFNKPIAERNIPVVERIVITHLIKENGKIAGAAGFSLDESKVHFFRAKSVILCTGAGGFKPNGFPICDLTHDGTVMAYNIGAKVTGKEWNDGHVGNAENPAACFDGWHGMFEQKPSVTTVEIRHDLGVELNYSAYKNGNPIQMGPPGMEKTQQTAEGPYRPAEFNQNGPGERDQGPGEGNGPGRGAGRRPKPPNGKGPKKGGAPPGMRGTSVGGSSAGMSIHKSEGLVPINDKCESNIPGLYAAGDALGSYMAGRHLYPDRFFPGRFSRSGRYCRRGCR